METLEPVVNPTSDLASARTAFCRFLETVPKAARIVALHDSDADGVSAGVVWQRAMERLGYENVVRAVPDRERSAWTTGNREAVRKLDPECLFVLDLGSKSEPVLPDIPTCFVDHHRPEGCPPGATLISAYSWDPVPNTSWMLWDLFVGLVEIADLDWIAVIGTLSDLGDSAPFSLIGEARKKYTLKYLKEATTLVNAARRASSYAPETAARALLSFADPRTMVNANTPDLESLRAAREEVKLALAEAKKAAPIFAGQVALIRLHSACQVHPLIAQIWRSRLPKYVVIAANDRYLPDRVNFSARSAPGINVLELLRSVSIPAGEGNFGHGHDQASGGSLEPHRWNALLTALGFDASVTI